MDNCKGLILAAGRGSRFISTGSASLPKVLQPVNNKPVISYVINAMKLAGIRDIIIVIGYLGELVKKTLGSDYSYVEQQELLGSGKAVNCAKDKLIDFNGVLVVMCGDSPMFTPATISNLLNKHSLSNSTITLASAIIDSPTGFGRIKRDDSGNITEVIEEKCASELNKEIREINGGLYSIDNKWLFENIDRLTKNSAGEYNLTEMVSIAIKDGLKVGSIECDPNEVLGINSIEQLQDIGRLLKQRETLDEKMCC